MPYDVHMVGSVPFGDAEEVFTRLSKALGARLPRIPDGETGRPWSEWMSSVFADHPQLSPTPGLVPLTDKPGAAGVRKFGLRPGVDVAQVRFWKLPLADVAIESYGVFRNLKAQGIVPAATRFQVAIAPAHMVVWRWMEDSLHAALEPVYDDALKKEIGRMLSAIPAKELAIQWDIASRVFARLEWGKPNRYGSTKAEMAETFARNLVELGNSVPADVELIFHFCYGDTGHRHTVEPTSTADMVDMANRVSRGCARAIELIHMPVPRDRHDDAYFAPLADLRLRPETALSLGLIHLTGGLEATKQRLATAHKYVKSFSVSTECGWGRRPPGTIPALLSLHADVAGMHPVPLRGRS